MFQTFDIRYHCGNYCMEMLHFCIKIVITSHQWELINELITNSMTDFHNSKLLTQNSVCKVGKLYIS